MKRTISAFLVMVMLVLGTVPAVHAENADHRQAADKLYALGLISGTGTDKAGNPVYELDRAPTRSEAITVLVKLLGKADEAAKGGWDMPFTDVPDWARNFVGYAYASGLTAGTSATTFGGDDPVTAAQYITFVLKALGYSANGDFAWDKAWELSDKLGVTDGRYTADTGTFLRGDVFLISEAALHVNRKGDDQTLARKLIAGGVFEARVYEALNGTADPTQESMDGAESLEALIQVLGEGMYTTRQVAAMLSLVRTMQVMEAVEADPSRQDAGADGLRQTLRMAMGQEPEQAVQLLNEYGDLVDVRLTITGTEQVPQAMVESLSGYAQIYRKELAKAFEGAVEGNIHDLPPEELTEFQQLSEQAMQMLDACLAQLAQADAGWWTKGVVFIDGREIEYTYQESPVLLLRINDGYYWFTS